MNPNYQPGRIIAAILLIVSLAVFSCRKDADFPETSGTLAFSADTLTFDTVFTAVGSITGSFKVYNPNNRKIIISSIRLGGGQSSPFRINADGVPVSNQVSEVEIAAKDSMYIFVKVTVDPTNENNPFIIMDSVIFETNGASQDVKLIAWGQNAHFFTKDTLPCNTTWQNDKPYVVMNFVMVDSPCTLNIDAGVRVYLHPGASLLVKGTLKINGTKTDSVVFQGDRLEHFFDDLPGQWNGIYFLRGSKNNDVNYAVIKNPLIGIDAGGILLADTATAISNLNMPDVKLHNTLIKNAYAHGISGFWADIDADNCLVYNCGGYNFLATLGGGYNFIHCTFANFGSIALEHKTPVIGLSNYYSTLGPVDLDANFTNCIVYGSLEEEIDTAGKAGAAFGYLFENCLLRTKRNEPFISVIKNSDPLFAEISKENFHLQSTSPAINAGKATPVLTDLDGKSRDAQPDIGCYEYTP